MSNKLKGRVGRLNRPSPGETTTVQPPTDNRADGYRQRLWLTLGSAAFTFFLIVLVWRAAHVLLLVFISLLLAVALRSLSRPLARLTRLPEAVALIAVVLLVLGLLLGSGGLFIPTLTAQVDRLIQDLPHAANDARAALGRYGWGERLLEEAPSPADAVPSLPSTLLPGVGNFFSFTFATLANTVFALFVGLFFAVNPKLYTAGLVRLFPPKHRPRAGVALERVGTTLRAWLLGQLVAMLSAGTLTTLGLLILGTPSALALGFLAGLFEFIPTIGALFAAVPAVLLAFADSPLQALYVAIVFFVVQQIQSNIIMPLVYQRAVSLPPALTLSGILLMGVLFGFLGVLVATPLVAVVIQLVKLLYLEDTLGETG